ncbi:olfactory receptor 56B34-like [Pleurodeles waltl]|uniref:olfactory receptor 56B34-like n=1 Tax=Pleurodeles waltl TaxID=8319 RepID=UPI003709922C
MTVITNSSFTHVTIFVFAALPWMKAWQNLLSILLAFLFILAIVANIFLTLIIYREQTLHEPMYYFFSMLSVVDLVLSLVTTPKILAILWFDAKTITLPGCFIQMFLIHCLAIIESGIFVVMAFDRYVAICTPLRYASVLTDRFVVSTMVVISLRSLLITIPVPILSAQLIYCSDYVIEHIMCSVLTVAKLACNDIGLTATYQLGIASTIIGSDLTLIFLSYCLILRAALKLHERGATGKALSTCISHFIIILFFYSMVFVLAINNASGNATSESTVLLNTLHFCVPPTLNPLVYGFRSKNIIQGFRNIFSNPSCSPN